MEFLVTLLPLAIMGLAMYFMIIRPQQKQARKKQDMLQSLNPGDAVVTIGGLHGVVDEVDLDNNLVVIDCEGVYLTFNINAVATVNKAASQTVVVEDLEPEEEIIDEE